MCGWTGVGKTACQRCLVRTGRLDRYGNRGIFAGAWLRQPAATRMRGVSTVTARATDPKLQPDALDMSGPDTTALNRTLRTTACFAIGVGLLEVVLRLLAFWILGSWPRASGQMVWTVPLVNLAFFTVAAIPLIVGERLLPRVFTYPRVTGFLGFLAAAVLTIKMPFVAGWAKLIIAAGVGVQIARGAQDRSASVERLSRRGSVVGALATLVLAIGVNVGSWGLEQFRRTGLGEARADAPNVLLLILDTVRAESLGMYGRSRPTSPNLEQLAADGVMFDRAVSTSPWTLPSHASLFTGRYPHDVSANWTTPLDDADSTLAEVFGARGWEPVGFTANLIYTVHETGLDRGFIHYEDYRLSWGQALLDSALGWRLALDSRVRRLLGPEVLNRKSATGVVDAFLGWSDGRGADPRPFFAFLNLFDAHEPYLPPEPYSELFGTSDVRPLDEISFHPRLGLGYLPNRGTRTPAQHQAELDAYESAITYMDAEIGRLVDALRVRGLLENTVLIVTADHGEQFGEHGLYGHSNSLYPESLWVPLVIRPRSGLTQGVRVPTVVSLRDVPATILELAGVASRPSPLPGASLARYWNEPEAEAIPIPTAVDGIPASESANTSTADWSVATPSWASPVIGSIRPRTDLEPRVHVWSLHESPWQIIHYEDGRTLLVDLLNDPDALVNLAGMSEHRQRAERMVEALRRLVDGQLAPTELTFPEEGDRHVELAGG